jgi:sulfur-oxidizing protein SoxY
MIEAELSRRSFAGMAGLGLLALFGAPRAAHAEAGAVDAELRRLFGGKAMATGLVRLDVPPVAENGLMVAITVEVESPMTPEDHVRSVHVFADGNPSPHVLTWHFTPASGRAAATGRIRLAQTQNVIAVAEMSDGALHIAKAQVVVTVGGCGK